MTTLSLPAFNPFQFANRLKLAGVPDKQAEAEAEVLHEAFTQQAQMVSSLENQVKALVTDRKRDAEQMATKEDIRAIKADIALLDAKITLVRRDTIIWLGGMLMVGFGSVIGVLFKLLG